MTDRPDLAALRALAEAATPGRWHVEVDAPGTEAEGLYVTDDGGRTVASVRDLYADAALIAACSPERILALIAEVEDRRGTVERIRAALDITPETPSYFDREVGHIEGALDREEAHHAR